MKKLILLLLLFAVPVFAKQHVPNNAVRQVSLTADTTNATTSLHGTPLQVTLDSNATWHFEAYLLTGSDGAAGLATAISIPSAATIIGEEFGTDTTADQYSSGRVTASATAGHAFNTAGDSTGWSWCVKKRMMRISIRMYRIK